MKPTHSAAERLPYFVIGIAFFENSNSAQTVRRLPRRLVSP
jgi:hypothetical protein